MWNIKKTEFYLEGLLHEIGLTYITNKLHHRKCFVRILFACCKTSETHLFAALTRSFLKFCDSWVKIRTVHFLWSNLSIYLIDVNSVFEDSFSSFSDILKTRKKIFIDLPFSLWRVLAFVWLLTKRNYTTRKVSGSSLSRVYTYVKRSFEIATGHRIVDNHSRFVIADIM